MARWRLLEPHYIFTDPGVKWEYQETDRTSGRQIRKQYDVPAYFHPEYEQDWNDKENRCVVVSDGHDSKPMDIIFKGEPTPGMYPLDDEAKAISSRFKDKWALPDKMYDMNQAGSYSANLADHFVQQQDKVNMKMSQLAESNAQGFGQFMQTMTAMMEQNQKILEILALKASGAEPPGEPNAAEKPSGQDHRRPTVTVTSAGRRI